MVKLSKPFRLHSLLLGVLASWIGLASAQSFQKQLSSGDIDLCGQGSSCAKRWTVSGGPGAVGGRLTEDTILHCSPSCTDASNPKVCSLIIALHGSDDTPEYMEWFMLGIGGGETYSEAEPKGGPFCIAFPKSAGSAWDYSCELDDADYVEGLILWARDEFPIDSKAVFLHGYSSGAAMIMNLMFEGCKVEPLVSALAPYAGVVNSALTTKAALLVIHGTHDNIVAYREDWINDNATPSCECNGWEGVRSCFNDENNIYVSGPTLAASVAILRGYNGDIFKDYPAPSGNLNLVPQTCQNYYDFCHDCQPAIDACINPNVSPNPFNEGYDCVNDGGSETDIIEFPTTEDSGPVILWKINFYNHMYPTNRESVYGATEIFFQIRKFFNNNRGQYSRGEHTVEQIATDVQCVNPGDFDVRVPPEIFFRNDIFTEDHSMTASRCKQLCENDSRCTDAFFVDYSNNAGTPPWTSPTDPKSGDKGCKMYSEPYPCIATAARTGVGAIHFKAGNAKPTDPPTSAPLTKAPSPTPITSSPVASPTTIESCVDSELRVMVNGKPRACKWAEKNTAKRCAKGNGRVAAHCPQTCGACSTFACEDSLKRFYLKNGVAKSCNWVKVKNIQFRCAKEGIDTTCRSTCQPYNPISICK